MPECWTVSAETSCSGDRITARTIISDPINRSSAFSLSPTTWLIRKSRWTGSSKRFTRISCRSRISEVLKICSTGMRSHRSGRKDRTSCRISTPAEDSMAMLWRNFLLANRGAHYTNQQGVVCKKFVNVYYPFTNDREFSRLAMSIHPKDSMYRRYYIRLYRRCHPRFAEIPYGDTLIPIRRPVLNHKLSKILISKNLS